MFSLTVSNVISRRACGRTGDAAGERLAAVTACFADPDGVELVVGDDETGAEIARTAAGDDES
jgi:hypothetical protein